VRMGGRYAQKRHHGDPGCCLLTRFKRRWTVGRHRRHGISLEEAGEGDGIGAAWMLSDGEMEDREVGNITHAATLISFSPHAAGLNPAQIGIRSEARLYYVPAATPDPSLARARLSSQPQLIQ
jgi:hypothetical protein